MEISSLPAHSLFVFCGDVLEECLLMVDSLVSYKTSSIVLMWKFLIYTALLTRMNSVKLIYLDFDQFIVTGSSELEKPLLIALSGEKEVV